MPRALAVAVRWCAVVVAGFFGCTERGAHDRLSSVEQGASASSVFLEAGVADGAAYRADRQRISQEDIWYRWTNAQAVYVTPACEELRKCLRQRLPSRYHPRRYRSALEQASECVQNVAYDGTCLPFTFAEHAENGRQIALVVAEVAHGCIMEHELAIAYDSVDEIGCRCLGLRQSSLRGTHCLVLPGP